MDDKENGEMANKGKIYLSKTSPKSVISAYMLQFRKDFMSFLKCRSKEVIPGGRMVLAFMGRTSTDPACEKATAHWDLIASTLMTMVSEVTDISFLFSPFSRCSLILFYFFVQFIHGM